LNLGFTFTAKDRKRHHSWMFFDGFGDLVRVFVVGSLAYFALLLSLRTSGKRTLSQLNAFDLVVTVALGSTLATVLLSSEVSLSEGLVALFLLIALQYSIAWLSVRSSTIAEFVKAEPTLLLYQGNMLESAMRQERVTTSEVQAAVRAQGLASPDQAFAVVLETNGNLSVITEAVGKSLPGLYDQEKQIQQEKEIQR
jgi:uncharacterized membrane protein YcaP (DUF421 family)